MKRVITSAFIIGIFTLSGFSQVKKVLLEDFTATWCGFCPEGSVTSDNLKSTYGSNYIFIQTHTSDGLEVTDGAKLDSDLSIFFYPNGTVDRFLFQGNSNVWMNESDWETKTEERMNTAALASVSFSNLEYDDMTKALEVDVNVIFHEATLDYDLAINLAIVEDSIPATGSLAQTNYSSSVQGGANPLTDWWHNHTLRDWLGDGPWGDTGDIPALPVIGTTYTKHYSYILSSDWNASMCHLIGTVSYKGSSIDNREVLNSEEVKLYDGMTTATNDLNGDLTNLSVYPNPSHGETLLQFEVSNSGNIQAAIYSIEGKKLTPLFDNYFNQGLHSMRLDLGSFPKGLYIIRLHQDDAPSENIKIVIE